MGITLDLTIAAVPPVSQTATVAATDDNGPLVDIFSGIVAFMSKSDPKYRELSRLLIAFDGDVTSDPTQVADFLILLHLLMLVERHFAHFGQYSRCRKVERRCLQGCGRAWRFVHADIQSSHINNSPGAKIVRSEWVAKSAQQKSLVDDAAYSL
jgi:hypothetical protein